MPILMSANSGIGLVTAKNLYKAGHHIILACRSESKAKVAMEEILTIQALGKVQFIHLDCSSLESVREFCDEFKKLNLSLDILINNAGIMWVPHGLTKDKVESHIGVNFLSHFYLTDLLIDTMKKGSKIINLSSLASFFVYSVNPGLVQTNLYSNSRLAKVVIKFGKSCMKDEVSGTFTTLRCALLPPTEGHGDPNVYYTEENLFNPPKAVMNESSIYLLIEWANETLKSLNLSSRYLNYKF